MTERCGSRTSPPQRTNIRSVSSAAPEGYTARAVTRDDVSSCTALAERYDRGLGLEPYPMRSFLEWIVQLSWINLGRDTGITNDGIIPLQSFLDAGGDDAVAATLESNGQGNPYPVVYVRKDGSVTEHVLAPDPLLDFSRPDYQAELRAVLEPVLSGAASPA